MRVTLRHLHFDNTYGDDVARDITHQHCLAFVPDTVLREWLDSNSILLYGEAYNEGRGSHLFVYADMDRDQALYYMLRWGSPAREEVTV